MLKTVIQRAEKELRQIKLKILTAVETCLLAFHVHSFIHTHTHTFSNCFGAIV